jgi:hypothetical protein
MLTQEHLNDLVAPYDEFVDPSWIAGAKAGLEDESVANRSREWEQFLTSLHIMIEVMPDIDSAEPGTAPSEGSLYEALGGFVSVTGKVTEQGLVFNVPLIRQRSVTSLFPGMTLLATGKEMTIPWSELASFLNLVPVRGPIESEMEVL